MSHHITLADYAKQKNKPLSSILYEGFNGAINLYVEAYGWSLEALEAVEDNSFMTCEKETVSRPLQLTKGTIHQILTEQKASKPTFVHDRENCIWVFQNKPKIIRDSAIILQVQTQLTSTASPQRSGREETELHSVISKFVIELRNETKSIPNANAVWLRIKNNSGKVPLIQEMTSDAITWRTSANVIKTLKRGSFNNVMRKVRKEILI